MSKAVLRRSERIYSFLLRFYPKQFRQEFGEEMKYVFSQSMKDAYAEKREQGVMTLWGRTIVDTGKTLVTQHVENQTSPLLTENSDGRREGGDSMKTKSTNSIMRNKDIASVFIVTAVILLIPLVAMQFTNDVDWKVFDFAVIGTLLIGTGLLVVLAARKIKNTNYRLAVIVVLVLALLLVWVHLAVGIVDTLPFAGS